MNLNYLQNLPASLFVFGGGEGGSDAASEILQKGSSVIGIFDNDSSKWGKLLNNRWQIQKPKKTDEVVAIGSMYALEIASQLKALGCSYTYFGPCFDRDRFFSGALPKEEIEWFMSELKDGQSLDVLNGLVEFRKTGDPLFLVVSDYRIYNHPRVNAQAGSVIVDGGAWMGDTAELFQGDTKGDCLVICFEPDHNLLDSIHGNNIIKVAKGLFYVDGLAGFAASKNSSQSHLIDDEKSDNKIEVTRLDSYRADLGRQINLIKLDIEGSERDAIAGASDVLLHDAPDLMISLYHRYDDLWMIPRLIKNINTSYRFFLGHHSQCLFDTVLYASTKV